MNKSEIFKKAHELAKNPVQALKGESYRTRLAFGLKRAFAIAKSVIANAKKTVKAVDHSAAIEKEVTVAEWIVKKNLTPEQSIVVCDYALCTGTVERETEKAVFVRFYSKMGVIKSWFPKSTLVK